MTSAEPDRPDDRRTLVEDGTWYTVDHPSAVGSVRRGGSVAPRHRGLEAPRAAAGARAAS